jgi:hypothetical protein
VYAFVEFHFHAVMLMQPYKEFNSDESTTADGGASVASLEHTESTMASLADTRRTDAAKEQPLLLRCQRLIGNSMHVDCISICPSSTNSDEQAARRSDTVVFVDWDDMLFPTTEIFDRWRMPTDMAMYRAYTLSKAQQSLLDAWNEALYQFLLALADLSERCVLVTHSSRHHFQDCLDAFAPKLRKVFDSPDGPHIVYMDEVPMAGSEDDFQSISMTSSSFQTMVADASQQLAAIRWECKDFFSTSIGGKWDTLSMDDIMCEVDALTDSSFRRVGTANERTRRKMPPLSYAPSISQMTSRMLLVRESLPLVVQYNVETLQTSPEPGRFEAIIGVLDEPSETVRHCPPRMLSRCRTKPAYEDYRHRRDLREYRDEFVEIVQSI